MATTAGAAGESAGSTARPAGPGDGLRAHARFIAGAVSAPAALASALPRLSAQWAVAAVAAVAGGEGGTGTAATTVHAGGAAALDVTVTAAAPARPAPTAKARSHARSESSRGPRMPRMSAAAHGARLVCKQLARNFVGARSTAAVATRTRSGPTPATHLPPQLLTYIACEGQTKCGPATATASRQL